MMSNFKQDILDEANSEPILALQILDARSHYSGKPRDSLVAPFVGRILTWHEAAPVLDYEYNDGFGSQDCHNIYAWTATRVLYIHEYDGSTYVTSVPRNPQSIAAPATHEYWPGEPVQIKGYSCGRCGCIEIVPDDTATPSAAPEGQAVPVAWQFAEHGSEDWEQCSEDLFNCGSARYKFRQLYACPQPPI